MDCPSCGTAFSVLPPAGDPLAVFERCANAQCEIFGVPFSPADDEIEVEMSEMKRVQAYSSNAGPCNIDVMLAPVENLAPLVAVDNRGRKLMIAAAGYRGLLPLDGLPGQVRIGNGEREADYTHGLLAQHYSTQHYHDQRSIERAEGQAFELRGRLAMLEFEPAVLYRDVWLVRTVARVVAFCDTLVYRLVRRIVNGF